MERLILITQPSTEQGTFGNIEVKGNQFVTGELPWKNNATGKSCIPAGIYKCVWHLSPSKGWVYEVTGVVGRDHILIHSGNFCGSTDDGLKSDFLGCIGLGKSVGEIEGQKAILSSRAAVAQFNALLGKEPFELEIRRVQ